MNRKKRETQKNKWNEKRNNNDLTSRAQSESPMINLCTNEMWCACRINEKEIIIKIETETETEN